MLLFIYENVSQKLGRLQISFVIILYNVLDFLKTCLILKVIVKWLLLIVWRLGKTVFSFLLH